MAGRYSRDIQFGHLFALLGIGSLSFLVIAAATTPLDDSLCESDVLWILASRVFNRDAGVRGKRLFRCPENRSLCRS